LTETLFDRWEEGEEEMVLAAAETGGTQQLRKNDPGIAEICAEECRPRREGERLEAARNQRAPIIEKNGQGTAAIWTEESQCRRKGSNSSGG